MVSRLKRYYMQETSGARSLGATGRELAKLPLFRPEPLPPRLGAFFTVKSSGRCHNRLGPRNERLLDLAGGMPKQRKLKEGHKKMRRLINLALLVAAAYLAYTYAWPFLQEQLDFGEPAATSEATAAEDEAWRCVRLAQAARDTVSDQLRQFSRPPVDPAVWSSALIHTAGELSSADSACRCGQAACRPAARALGEMRRLIDQFDRAVRGNGSGFVNPASYQEEIDRLLDDAEAALP